MIMEKELNKTHLAPDQKHIEALNESDLLAEVLGFETHEVATEAHGTDLTTLSGKHFIDFTGGIAVHACGHNHPAVVQAITSQAREVLHTSDVMRHAPQLELAEFMRGIFAKAIPGSQMQFVFMNSGSESVDSAAKLALKATGRSQFIAFDGAFHGRTLFASALSRSKTAHWAPYEQFLAPLRSKIHHAPAPRCEGRDQHKGTDRCCADGLEELLAQHGSDVAAVFMEAEQGEGGYFPMAQHAARKIRALTKQYGVLLVADEIQSGWGRTGRWFGFEHLGIEPDIVVFGKAAGGGLPLAGVAASAAIMDRWQPGEHGTTFGGNPIACAAGLAALRTIQSEGLVERADELGQSIKARLSKLVGQHGIVDVRGNGLMLAVELRDAQGKPDYARCEAVKMAARAKGLLMLTCGAKNGGPADCAAMRLIPPLNTSDSAVSKALDILEDALRTA